MAQSPIYSKQFVSGSFPGGTSESFVVPAGFVWVIRDVSGTSFTPPGDFCLVICSAGGNAFVEWRSAANQFRNMHWEGRVVIPSGSALELEVDGFSPAASLVISGYALKLP